MVVFTCNHCGESLQKPKVEKHYNFVCRKIKNLTCVDCFKDFKGEEYSVHTKCITEEERYAAKGTYVNGIVKKGDVKQESWVAHIRGIIEKEIGLKKPLKDLLITISKHNNIPRKKRKFINYLTNSLGGRVNMKDIEAVWDIIEKHKDQENTTDTTKTVESNDNSVVSTDNGKNENVISKQDSQESPTKKKTKKQNEELITDEQKHLENENNGNISQQDSQEPPTKKKKKKKQNENIITDDQERIEDGNNESVMTEKGNNENVINEENKQDSQGLRTEKKKKKKQNGKIITDEQKHIGNGNNESVITGKENNENVINEENKQDSQELRTEKKKKKKPNGKIITDDQKHIENGNNESVITEKGNNENVINEENKQDSQELKNEKKKKKKQKELITEEQNHIENGINEGVSMENGNNENVIGEENKQELSIKKKKRKVDMNAPSNETDIPEAKILKTDIGAANLDTETSEEIGKFNMKAIILSILEKKRTISLKKLEKKVLSAAKRAKDESDDLETVVKRIHKKLKKMPVQIRDDQVCLVVE